MGGVDEHDEARDSPDKPTRHPLRKPHVKHRLVHELARGEKTHDKLAGEYGVGRSGISEFASRHAAKIEEVRADLENEFAGLWIAQKAARIAELAEMYDDDTLDPEERKIRKDLLRAAAEELGQIPNKAVVSLAQPVTVRLEGVNVDDL